MKRRVPPALVVPALLAAAAFPATGYADSGTVQSPVGGSVASTLTLTAGSGASFGAFTPGVEGTYSASLALSSVSTAGAATLSVSDPSAVSTGHLVNGGFALPSALQVQASSPNGQGGVFAPVGSAASPTNVLSYGAPVANDPVTVSFQQHIGAADALRTGNYAKTLTFTLAIQEGGPQQIAVSSQADAPTVSAGANIGFRVTVSNPSSVTAQAVHLSDALPYGNDLSWVVDGQSGISSCGASGPVAAQQISCPTVDLPPGASYWVHVMSHTSKSTDSTIANHAFVTSPNTGDDDSTSAVSVSLSSCQNSAADPTRTLAFDDEFNSNSVDTTKWTTDTLPFGGYQGSTHYHNTQYGSYIIPQNLSEHDGNADLQTNDVPVVSPPDLPGMTFNYTEAYMHTKSKFSRTGGFFEMCAKFPAGKGLWPAFWLAAQNGNWPPEMDIAEWFGSIEGMQIGQPFATGSNAGNMWQSAWFYGPGPTQGYHDYAMWWTTSSPAKIEYFLDGRLVHEIDGTTSNLISNTPMYIILNSGTWAPSTRGGPPDATTVFPNSFLVDYVRVYTTPPPTQPDSSG